MAKKRKRQPIDELIGAHAWLRRMARIYGEAEQHDHFVTPVRRHVTIQVKGQSSSSTYIENYVSLTGAVAPWDSNGLPVFGIVLASTTSWMMS